MQSVVVLLIDHGEDTDSLAKTIDDAFFVRGQSVLNYELAVDIDSTQAERALSVVRDLHSDYNPSGGKCERAADCSAVSHYLDCPIWPHNHK